MPTGYTADLMDLNKPEPSFTEFAELCMRAMGVAVTMRDSMDKKVPEEFQIDNYYVNSLAEAKKELEEWNSLSYEEKAKFLQEQHEKKRDRRAEYLENAQKENARLDRMIEKVRAWEPPTPDHVNFKNFMLEQLEISKNNTEYYEKVGNFNLREELKNYEESLIDSVKYREEYLQEEIDRVNSRNKWLKEVRASLYGQS